MQRLFSQTYLEIHRKEEASMLRAELALRWRPLEAGEAAQPLARWGATFTPLTTTQVLVSARGA